MNPSTLAKQPTPILNRSTLPVDSMFGESKTIGWKLSPTPYTLTPEQYQAIVDIGPLLHRFLQALDLLYKESTKGQMPDWIASLLDAGKPEALIQFSRMKRFNRQLPTVIRPDLLVTETGFALCEIDAVPGGIGFTAALNQVYEESGFSVIGNTAMARAFLTMLRSYLADTHKETHTDKYTETPVIVTLLSEEAWDYYPELSWLTRTIQTEYPHFYLAKPQHVSLHGDSLVLTSHLGVSPESTDWTPLKIDAIYRFFELFDLPNLPHIELIQYAVKKRLVTCLPPFKPQLEEKLMFGLLWHPLLAPFWKKQLTEVGFARMLSLVPRTWILDPAVLPPQAVIPDLLPAGVPLQGFSELSTLSQSQRQLVIKPSGFSPLAWGSRGVVIGHDVSQEAWAKAVSDALLAFNTTPHILQRYEKPKREDLKVFSEETTSESSEILPFSGRTRLCPYYFVDAKETVTLSGILATSCPADKKRIHGMRDAILAPCMVQAS